MKSCVDMI